MDMNGLWSNRLCMQGFCIIILLLLFSSCKGGRPVADTQAGIVAAELPQATVSYVNAIRIHSPQNQELYAFHSEVQIRFERTGHVALDSTHVYVNNRWQALLGKDISAYTMKVPAEKTGEVSIRLESFHGDGQRSTATRVIRVKPDKAPCKYTYEIVKVYPHDPKAYTQGLVYQDGYMYEGTGMYGRSGLRKVDLEKNEVISMLNIERRLFGEGITIYKDKIYQLTWTSRKGFVYDLHTFAQESTFTYATQGWGITTVGDELVMSDGSHKLYRIEPDLFGVLEEVEVYDHNGPVASLNELEYINGLIWANIWQQDRIIMIDPGSGEVKGELDMSGLLSRAERQKLDELDDVLNGIAYDAGNDIVFVTGKHWPKMFAIQVK